MDTHERCKYEDRWGELKIQLKDILTKLTSIEEQTIKTNGRVRKLELFRYVGTSVLVAIAATAVFMLYASEQGWVEAILKYGGK